MGQKQDKENDPLTYEHHKIGLTELRKSDIDILKGARQVDQLEALKLNVLRPKKISERKLFATIFILSAVLAGGIVYCNSRRKYCSKSVLDYF